MAVVPMASVLTFHFRSQVTAKGHDIFYPYFAELGNFFLYRFFGGRHTGKMCKSGYIIPLLNVLGNIKSIFAGSTTGAISHAHKGRVKRGNFFGCCLYTFKGRVNLRWKNLKREG